MVPEDPDGGDNGPGGDDDDDDDKGPAMSVSQWVKLSPANRRTRPGREPAPTVTVGRWPAPGLEEKASAGRGWPCRTLAM